MSGEDGGVFGVSKYLFGPNNLIGEPDIDEGCSFSEAVSSSNSCYDSPFQQRFGFPDPVTDIRGNYLLFHGQTSDSRQPLSSGVTAKLADISGLSEPSVMGHVNSRRVIGGSGQRLIGYSAMAVESEGKFATEEGHFVGPGS